MSVWRHISNLTVLVGARLAGAVLGVAGQLILTRFFSRDDVGLVFLAMSATAFVSLFMTAGYPALSVAYLARYHSLGRHKLVEAFNAAARRESLIASLVTLATIGLCLVIIPWTGGIREAMIYGCIAAIPYSVIRLNSSGANALRRFSLSYVPDFVFRPGLLLAAIAGLALWQMPYPVEWVLWAYVAITFGVAAYQARALGVESVTHTPALSGGGPLLRPYRKRAWALVIVALVTLTLADVVTLLAGLFLPQADVAVLGIAIRLAALAGFITQSSQQFVMRDLTSAMAKGNTAEAKILLLRTNLTSLVVMAGALAGAGLLGEFVLGIFGAEYRAGYWPLMLFLVSQMVRAASGMNSHLLSLGGHQVRSAGMCVMAVAALVIATAILAPTLGVLGVAIAAVIAETVWAVALALLTQKLTGKRGDIFAVLKP